MSCPVSTRARRLSLVGAVLLATACTTPRAYGPSPRPTSRTPTRTLARPPAEVARLLSSSPFKLRDIERAATGVMGVSKAMAHFPQEGLDLPVKWAPAPSDTLDGWNAAPRKELATLAIQQWFLDPDDWVVPPTSMRCVPLREYPRVPVKPNPAVPGTRCVLGLIAAWLQHVSPVESVFDPERFEDDEAYAARVADFNLLLYLIEHRDGRSSNILVSDDGRRIYSIDNGIAFGNLVWNYFVVNWDVLRVPALRRESVDRLRRVTRADLNALAVVRELRVDRKRVLQPAEPSAPFDPAQGARVRTGHVQLGLTTDEIAGVAERLQQLLARVDAGEIATF
jgi:hypothetical protein